MGFGFPGLRERWAQAWSDPEAIGFRHETRAAVRRFGWAIAQAGTAIGLAGRRSRRTTRAPRLGW